MPGNPTAVGRLILRGDFAAAKTYLLTEAAKCRTRTELSELLVVNRQTLWRWEKRLAMTVELDGALYGVVPGAGVVAEVVAEGVA